MHGSRAYALIHALAPSQLNARMRAHLAPAIQEGLFSADRARRGDVFTILKGRVPDNPSRLGLSQKPPVPGVNAGEFFRGPASWVDPDREGYRPGPRNQKARQAGTERLQP